jgi:hypothetical protein
VRLERLRRESENGRVRAVADVVWEQAGLPAQSLRFEVAEALGADLEPSPEAFALAALPAAVWRGERRLWIDGSLCPHLASNLSRLMQTWSSWYEHCRPIGLEPARGLAAPPARLSPRAALFLSGGVDSLALLRRSRTEHPVGDPEAPCDAIVLFGNNGFEFEGGRPVSGRLAAYQALLARLAPLAERESLTLVPVHFDARWLLPGYRPWTSLAFGPMIASVAHALWRRNTLAWLGSSSIRSDRPHGSRPDIDPLYSSGAVEIRVGDPDTPRFEKIRRIADWEPALAVVQPCWLRSRRLADGRLNCGRCEKCLRTMLALLVLDRLSACSAFAEDDVRAEWIDRVAVPSQSKLDFLLDLEEPLARRGRRDLVRALRRLRRRFRRDRLLQRARWRLRSLRGASGAPPG